MSRVIFEQNNLWRGWEIGYRRRDPHNLIAMIDIWLRCDLSQNSLHRGDYCRAMALIKILNG